MNFVFTDKRRNKMRKRLVVVVIVFGIAWLAGLSIFNSPASAVGDVVVNDADRVVLHGNVHPRAVPEFDVGPTDPSLPMNRMILLLKLTPEKQAELDRLLAEQQDPSSPNFHKWLKPEEFGERFGRSSKEIETAKGWLVTHGFTIEETAKSASSINFSGTAAQVEGAFKVKMRDYRVEGQLRHANSNEPSIPRALADLVAGPVSLHNFPLKAMHARPRPTSEKKLQPDYTDPYGNHSLVPGDFAAIYHVKSAYSLGYDGTGVTIAVAERTHPDPSKWDYFRANFLLPYNPPNVIVNGFDPGDLGPDEDAEADLDVEWAGAVAKGATIDFVVSASTFSTDGVNLSSQYIVDNNLSAIMSVSFGLCESALGTVNNSFFSQLWEEAASLGITVFVGTGDFGAYDCVDSDFNPIGGKAVNGIASTPYNIAVGGTRFNTSSVFWSYANAPDFSSALGYIPEVAWNDWSEGYYNASGGGPSAIYGKPSWQVSPGVPNDGARDVPDVSLSADDNIGYNVYTCTNDSGNCIYNSWWIFGGTSCGTPSFAGIMGLIVQSEGGERQGNANATLYQLGNAQYRSPAGIPGSVFHDITSGNNSFGAAFPGYSCRVGYDLVTGLGTVDATNLLLAFNERWLGAISVQSLQIDGGAASTANRVVTLNNTVTRNAAWYMASESSTFNGALWKRYSAAPSFTLSTGNGTKTVYFRVKNPAGVSPIVSAQIVLAQSPEVTSFTIDNGAAHAIHQEVTLNNTAIASPTQFMASESENFVEASWQPYSRAPSFTLSPAPGSKTVYFVVQNSAGVSNVMSSTIFLFTPPTLVSFEINGGNTSTQSPTVTLNNFATGPATGYMASEFPSFFGAVWEPYSSAPTFTLSPGRGARTVYLKVSNPAGISQVMSCTITLE